MPSTGFPPLRPGLSARLRTSAALTLLFSLLLTSAAVLQGILQITVETNTRHSREAAVLSSAATIIGSSVEHLFQDLDMLEGLPAMQAYLAAASPTRQAEVNAVFVAVARAFPYYDQIRVLDSRGRERVRVNQTDGEPLAIPVSELQDKADRYYVQAGLRLRPGQTYVSPLDLNVEHGRIESPHKPMIRLVRALGSPSGELAGLLIINFRAQGILTRFQQLTRAGEGLPMLLNAEGGWLSSPREGDSWAFMEERAKRFPAEFPDAWALMTQQPKGHIVNQRGSFVFHSIALTAPGSDSTLRWIALSWFPEERAALLIPALQRATTSLWYGPSLLLALLLSVLLSRLLLQRRYAARQLAESTERLRIVTSTLAEGVLMLDATGRIRFSNPEACRLLGFSAEALNGQSAHALIHTPPPGYAPAHTGTCPILAALRAGERVHFPDEMFWLANGSAMPVSVRMAPIPTGQGGAGSVLTFHDTSERKRFLEELQARTDELALLATQDPLTQLANRRHFNQHAEREWLASLQQGESFAVIMVDVDHFKQYNDHYGHQAGDGALTRVGAILHGHARRPRDLAARYGGEEFVLILPGASLEHAGHVAASIRAEIHALQIPHQYSTSGTLTVSLGVTACQPRACAEEGLSTLVRKADMALYEAKTRGRDRAVLQTLDPETTS